MHKGEVGKRITLELCWLVCSRAVGAMTKSAVSLLALSALRLLSGSRSLVHMGVTTMTPCMEYQNCLKRMPAMSCKV